MKATVIAAFGEGLGGEGGGGVLGTNNIDQKKDKSFNCSLIP